MSHEEQNQTSSQCVDPLESWTKYEKYILLQSIKIYTSHDIEQIAVTLPDKTPEQIKAAIAYYKKKVLKHPRILEKRKNQRRKINIVSRVPLNSWAKLLTDSLNFKELQTETATALRIIAEFESFPKHGCTEDIDFKKVYHLLANALEGKALPDDKILATVIEKCLLETALTSKEFIRKTTFKSVIESINWLDFDKEINAFPRPTSSYELAAIRYLISQRAYNPLKISESVLKQTVFTDKK